MMTHGKNRKLAKTAITAAVTAALAATGFVRSAYADDLALFDLLSATNSPAGGSAGNIAAATASTVGASVSVSQLTRGAAFSAATIGNHAGWGAMNTTTDKSYSDLTTAISNNFYAQVSIAPTVGNSLSLSTFDVALYEQNLHSAATVAVQYSLDGFATPTDGITVGALNPVPGDYNGALQTVDLTGFAALQNVTSTVTFRLFFYGFGGWESRGIGAISGNNTDLGILGTTASTLSGSNWVHNGDGSFSTAGNWSPTTVPDSAAAVTFGSAITSAHVITLDSAVTVGSITFNNGNQYTLAPQSSSVGTLSANSITVTSGSHLISAPVVMAGTLAVNVLQATDTLTLSGGLSETGGPQNLAKSGPGTLALNAPSSFTGGTTISAGKLQLGHANALQNSLVTVSVDNGLTFAGGIGTFNIAGLAGANAVTLTDASSGAVVLSVGANNSPTTYAGSLGGLGSLTKVGSSTLTLTGASTAAFTISSGTLQIGAGGTTGSVSGNITNNAALVFNRSDNYTYSGAITGAGSISKLGGSVLTLSGSSAGTGIISFSTGELDLASANLVGAGKASLNWTGGVLGIASNAADAVYDINSGYGLNLLTTQAGWKSLAGTLQAKIETNGLLLGNTTGAQYGTLAGGKDIEIHAGAVLALATGAPEPLATDIQGGSTVVYGVTANNAVKTLGPGTIYSGAQFSWYTPGGSFSGTLTEATTGSGFNIDLETAKDFSGAKFNVDATSKVTVIGSGQMTVGNGGMGNDTTGGALTVLRQGTASTRNTSLARFGNWGGDNIIRDGQTYQIQDGVFEINSNGNGNPPTARNVVSLNGTVEALSGGTINLNFTDQINPGSGGIIIRDGGGIFIDNTSALDNLRELTVAPGAKAYLHVTGTVLTTSTKFQAFVANVTGIIGANDFYISGGDLKLGNGAYVASGVGAGFNLRNNGTETNKVVPVTVGSTIGFDAFGNTSGIFMDVSAVGSTVLVNGNSVTAISGGSFSRASEPHTASNSVEFHNSVTAQDLIVAQGQASFIGGTSSLNLTGTLKTTAGSIASVRLDGAFVAAAIQWGSNGNLSGDGVNPLAGSTLNMSYPIEVLSGGTLYLKEDNTTNSTGTTNISNLTLDANSTFSVDNKDNHKIDFTNVTLAGTGSTIDFYSQNSSNMHYVGNVSGSGAVTVLAHIFENNAVVFDGAINSGVTVHYGTGTDYNTFLSHVTNNFQLNGGTFSLDVGSAFTLPDTALVHTGTLIGNGGANIDNREHLYIAYGQDGKVWGAAGSGLTIQAAGGNPVTFYANDNASGTSGTFGGIVNEFAGVFKVAAGDSGIVAAYPDTVTAGGYGTVQLDHVQIGNAGKLSLDAQDSGTHLMLANVDLQGAGTVAQIQAVNHYGGSHSEVDNVNGAGTLSVIGGEILTLNGTIAPAAKVALNGWNGGDAGNYHAGVAITLGSNFVLNGTLEVNRDTTTTDSYADASAFTATGLQMGNGAQLGGTGTLAYADVVMNGNNTLYSSGTLHLVNAWGANGGGGGHLLVSGTGNQIPAGSTIALSGTWNAGTTINAGGALAVNGTLTVTDALVVAVNVSGTLSGSGTLNAAVATVTNGSTSSTNGHIAPGTSVAGTLTVNNTVSLANNTYLDFLLNTPDVAAGTGGNSLLKVMGPTGVDGGLTLGTGVTLTITPGANFNAGTYHLISYTGALADYTSAFTGWTVAGNGLGTHTYSFQVNAGEIDLIVVGSSGISAGSGTWTSASGTDVTWSTQTNWSGGYPSAAGHVATFGNAGLAVGTAPIDLSGNQTVGGIVLATTAGTGYTLGVNTASNLTLDNGAGTASIQATTGTHTLVAPVVAASDTNVSVADGASLHLAGGVTNNSKTLTLSTLGTGSLNAGAITGTAGSTVVSSGTASATSISQNSLSIAATAALKITPTNTPNTAASTSVLSSLTIAGSTGNWTGQLDMGNNSLVIKNGGSAVLGTVADEIRQGMGLSTTIDPGHHGITSSTALTNAAGDTTLGYAVASDIQPTGTFAFAGQTVGGNDVLVKYTWKADANLDGIVNVADLGILATNYGLTDKSWVTADFNGDGLVNVADLGLLATYYGRGTSPSQSLMSFQDAMAMFPQFGGTGSVPEPTSLGLLGLGAVGLLARRRRR